MNLVRKPSAHALMIWPRWNEGHHGKHGLSLDDWRGG